MPTKDKNDFSESAVRVMSFADITDGELENREYEILKTGEYFDPRYGKFTIDRAKLETLKRNFDENVLQIDVAVDANHEPEKGALAWIKSLKVDGDRLLMSIKDISSDGKKVLRDKVFKYFSVEFAPHTKVEDGKKITIFDVLKGVALTNRPVIKGMAPTFFSETVSNSFTSNDNNMSVFKKLSETLTKRGKVTSGDLELVRAAFNELPAEEQAEAKPVMDEVEAKAVETADAEAKAADEAKKKADEDAAKAAAEGGSAPEAVQAAEAKAKEAETKLAEANATVATLLAEKKERVLAERVSSFMLSETQSKGFSKANEEALKSFVTSLSDEQYSAFSELMGKYSVVNVQELGSGSEGKSFSDEKVKVGATEYKVKGADVDAEIKALAEEKKISYYEAAQLYAESK